MISLRHARGVGLLKQGLRCRPGLSEAAVAAALGEPAAQQRRHHNTAPAVDGCMARATAVRQQGIFMRGASRSPLPPLAWGLHSARGFSGGLGGRNSDRQGRDEGDEGKAPYTFLERGDGVGVPKDLKDSKGGIKAGKVSAEAGVEEEEEVDFKSLTMWQRVQHVRSTVKLMWKRYGLVAIGTNITLYVAGLGGLYAVLATGLVEPNVDVSELMQRMSEYTGADSNETLSYHVKRIQHLVKTNREYEQFFMAFVANEFLELPRNVVVFFVTPSIARAIGRAPPKAPKKAN